jgi:hypothetical protein
MPIFMLKPETAKKLTTLMEGWVRFVRGSGSDDTLVDHSVIYLSGAAAALDLINYQNDLDKIDFARAIYSVVRDIEERGDEALKEWLEKLVDPQKIAASDGPHPTPGAARAAAPTARRLEGGANRGVPGQERCHRRRPAHVRPAGAREGRRGRRPVLSRIRPAGRRSDSDKSKAESGAVNAKAEVLGRRTER